MKISSTFYYQNIKHQEASDKIPASKPFRQSQSFPAQDLSNPSFRGNAIKNLLGPLRFLQAQCYVYIMNKVIAKSSNGSNILFRHLCMENMEGIQYGIKAFKGLSMKDIQYMSENLHVIAVKRGCKNMCAYCYADAKPSKRAMSWEDFKLITDGYKKLKKRLGNLPIFGENMTNDDSTLIYRSTELFYDADCMDLVIKDKKGRNHDFIDLSEELYNSLKRKTVFDTSGWDPNNKELQQRAEKYAEYFSCPENMEKLNGFNLSFNCFNASYVSGVKALKAGNKERYLNLKDRFTDRIANAVYTFTPLLNFDKFQIMTRSFGVKARNAEYFDIAAIFELSCNVLKKLETLYRKDLNGAQKYVKSEQDIKNFLSLAEQKLNTVDTALNSVGRMKKFMAEFKINAPMQNHDESTIILEKDLETLGRYHSYLGMKLIDTDGRVYHMDYARFFPTEIQLNLKDKSPAPKLANLKEDFKVLREIINRPEQKIRIKPD